jgi:predicted alpha/beta superfamily hydrolase
LNSERRFPVVYLHDGQNLFDPETAFAGNPWYADEVAEREIRAGRIEPLILVGVANSVDRLREYGPRLCGPDRNGDLSREYAQFLVEEVKPFIDATYRTLPGPEQTGTGGASMGGLISLYLCKWYPDVFRRCAAMSPSLWWDQECFLHRLHLDAAWLDLCRIWIDMGTREGGSEAGMKAMSRRFSDLARRFANQGLREGENFSVLAAEDGMHNEESWGRRFDRVLQFLYGKVGH